MKITDLQEKEVINCFNCEKLGYVYDLDFNPCNGCIESIIVPGPCKFLGLFIKDSDYVIPWKCIKQIGQDIILVDIPSEEYLKKTR